MEPGLADLNDSVGGDHGAAVAAPANRSQTNRGLTAISMAVTLTRSWNNQAWGQISKFLQERSF